MCLYALAGKMMERRLLTFLLLIFSALSASGQRTRVMVESGSGDGNYRGPNLVHAWADPSPAGMVFDRWTGDTQLLQNSFEAHTRVNSLALNIHLTATYKPAPVWAPVTETIAGTTVVHHFPAKPFGVIFRFHGAGGSATNLFSSVENRIFNNDAAAENYAVVAVNSFDQLSRQWDNTNVPPNNRDIENIQTIISTFISRGWMSKKTSIFAVGISSGGQFAPRVSLFLDFNGTAIYIAPGQAGVINQTGVPTIWCFNVNDTAFGPNALSLAQINFANLVGRNIPAEFNLNRPSPVYPERFWRIPGLTADDSRAIHNALRNGNFIDRRDYLTANPRTSDWEAVIPAAYNSYLPEIADQLDICYAEHKFFSDYNRRVLDFFNAQRP